MSAFTDDEYNAEVKVYDDNRAARKAINTYKLGDDRDLKSELGIETEHVQESLRNLAYKDYGMYKKYKEAELENIRKEALDFYKALIDKYMDAGESLETARSKAKSAAEHNYKALKKIWLQKYPTGTAKEKPM